jgi:hypothetical protein
MCLEPSKNPRKITKCGHSFCLECINKVANRALPSCQVCKTPFDKNQLQIDDEINNGLERLRAIYSTDRYFPKENADATTGEKLYDFISQWPTESEAYQPGYRPYCLHGFQTFATEIINDFIENKLSDKECTQILEILKKFRKDIQGPSKEILKLSETAEEYLNHALSILDLPKDVLEHSSFNREFLKFKPVNEIRDTTDKILKKAHVENPLHCHYFLRPSTRGLGDDTVQCFTLNYIDCDATTRAVRLGFFAGKWEVYNVSNNTVTITNTLGSLEELLKTFDKKTTGEFSILH